MGEIRILLWGEKKSDKKNCPFFWFCTALYPTCELVRLIFKNSKYDARQMMVLFVAMLLFSLLTRRNSNLFNAPWKTGSFMGKNYVMVIYERLHRKLEIHF